ncbi:hypothetical protein JCM18899A_51990 [Nocardioides sp. AN3]
MQWPELFVGLTPGQRHAVVRHLAQTCPAGHEPTRDDVDATVQYIVGEITPSEYARHCSSARLIPAEAGRVRQTDR